MLKTIKRIICPVDVYDFQPEAAEYAMTLANALDAKITVLYVFEPLPSRYDGYGYTINPSEQGKTMTQKAEAKMSEILSEFFNSSVAKGEVVLGLAADQIAKVAEESSADIIVMASHGRSALGRVIHGSVTNKVLADTKIPVLVITPSKGQ